MDSTTKQHLTDFGLGECIKLVEEELELFTMNDINETDVDDDYAEIIKDAFPPEHADNLILFIKTHKTARMVSQRADFQSTERSSTRVDASTGRDMRECYLLLLNNRSKTVKERQEYFYKYFILPYISNIDETLDEKTYINFEGRTYEFNQNTISIGRGCLEYPVDIQIKHRNPCDLSVSRVNCIITRVRSDEGYVYNLLDAWSMVETRVTKTNPMNTLITSKENVNIISWNSKETVYISCGDRSCNNKIQFISNIPSSSDQEDTEEEKEEIEQRRAEVDARTAQWRDTLTRGRAALAAAVEVAAAAAARDAASDAVAATAAAAVAIAEEDGPTCVICFEPATIRLSCGHATYCSSNCLDEHVAHQNTTTDAPECPYCKTNWQYNKVSVCERYYKTQL